MAAESIPSSTSTAGGDPSSPSPCSPLARTEQYLYKLQQPPYPPPCFTDSAQQLLVPPLNFALVVPGIYRSGHPNPKNHSFLTRLGIRTVIYMNEDDPQPDHVEFMNQNNINFHHFRVEANKEPFTETSPADIAAILAILMGKQSVSLVSQKRIGCLVGCLRKIQSWSMAAIFDEYQRFSGTKIRIADQQFIELFDESIVIDPEHRPLWLT
ncbi:tyrosine-protein phosphatase siw14 [Dimargaris cristalligena]|nr:tyrosine-protein phosphatase siw14 [Dimargaris cristalligena]